MKLPETIEKALEILSGSGFEAFVVGGCVRDMIMGKTPFDYDITTNALPKQTAECFKDYRVIETGIKHGTVTVVIDGENIEITTYRVDGEYVDNRRPENVTFTASITEDLARRDFTMNAICYNPERGLVDPFLGQKDIEKSTIKCVGEPDTRFNEDGLRILRALRFASQTGFEIETETDKSVRKNKELIKNISAERIFSEFKKLLCGKNAHKVLKEYREVIAVFIPEIAPEEIYFHTVDAIEKSENSEIIRFALFLRDTDKPREILLRLKSDRYMTDMVTALAEFRNEKIIPDKGKLKNLISQKGFEFVKLLIKLQKADKMSKLITTDEIDRAAEMLTDIEEKKEPVFINDLAVTGSDMILLGLKGKGIGDMLEKLLSDVHADQTLNAKEKLLEKAEVYLINEKG